jgi:hypothetical protein
MKDGLIIEGWNAFDMTSTVASLRAIAARG